MLERERERELKPSGRFYLFLASSLSLSLSLSLARAFLFKGREDAALIQRLCLFRLIRARARESEKTRKRALDFPSIPCRAVARSSLFLTARASVAVFLFLRRGQELLLLLLCTLSKGKRRESARDKKGMALYLTFLLEPRECARVGWSVDF